jgi:hypothetical protein
MTDATPTPEELQRARVAIKRAGKSLEAITPAYLAKKLGCDAERAGVLLEKLQEPESAAKPELAETREFDGDKATITKSTSERIHTLDQLLAFCEVDGSEWEVERWICNKWEVGAKDAAKVLQVAPLYQVKAWLKRKVHVVNAKAEIEALRKKAEEFAPKYPAIITRNLKQSGNLGEFSIVDLHIGCHAWGKETGWADYDVKIARKSGEDAVNGLMSRMSPFKLDEAILVLGNDQQNADNRQGTTEHGTAQSMDTRYQKVFGVSRDWSIWAVEQLRGIAAKVTVVVVAGNHDPLAAWHLGDSLTSWFRRCPSVTVDNSPAFRKYREFGVNMLMYTHGNCGKLDLYGEVMAAEQPQMWGRTFWREAHTGDKHHRRVLELKGATVRILPSLRPPDAWTSESQYVGSIRAAEGYIFNRDEGLISTATYSILDKNRAA